MRMKVGEAHVPRPFPGMWPTRIGWRVEKLDPAGERISTLQYVGKPNAYQVREFLRLIERSWDSFHFWEFDKKNLLCNFYSGAKFVNPILWRVYHPWQACSTNWALTTFYTKKLGGFTVYSPYRVLKREYIDAHKAWLAEDDKVRLKRAKQQVPAPAPIPTPRIEVAPLPESPELNGIRADFLQGLQNAANQQQAMPGRQQARNIRWNLRYVVAEEPPQAVPPVNHVRQISPRYMETGDGRFLVRYADGHTRIEDEAPDGALYFQVFTTQDLWDDNL